MGLQAQNQMFRKVFSCGGGVQSTACLVLAAKKEIDFPVFIFANVGDKAEDPLTIQYIQEVLKPYAKTSGITWIDVQKKNRKGVAVDLYDDLLRPTRTINIPVRMKNGSPGNRNCTAEWKIKPIAKWIKTNALGCELGKGISTDEPHRATPSRESDVYKSVYPLMELGIDRAQCLRIVKEAGLPQPPKSACWFCPYKTGQGWTDMKTRRPELFNKAVELEQVLNEKRRAIQKDEIYFSGLGASRGLGLDQVFVAQNSLFPEWIDEQDGCESGYCMT